MDEKAVTHGQVVAIAGTNCSGKDTVGDHLALHHHFQHVSVSSVLRAEATRRGLPQDRETLIAMNVALRQEMGPGGVVMRAIDGWRAMEDQYPGGIALTSVRVVCEADEVLRQGALLLFIDAPVEVRYARSLLRPRPEDRVTSIEDFMAMEERELAGLDGPDRPWLREVQRMATTTIINDRGPLTYLAAVEARLGLSGVKPHDGPEMVTRPSTGRGLGQ
jgi:adenylate kinase family enzyme